MTEKSPGALIRRREAMVLLAAAAAAPTILGTRAAFAQGAPELRIGVPGPTSGGSINPVKIGTGIPDQFFVQPAYDSLIIRQPDGTLAPGLALEWGANDAENKTFQMKLRPGVTFSTGEPFDAASVKNWIEWFRDGTGIFAARFKDVESVDTPDELTVVMNLAQSDAAWPSSFTQDRYGYVVSPQGTQAEEALANDTFGTGPYMLDKASTVTQSSYTYLPRPGYWNPEAVRWSKVTITVISDPAARLSAVQAGQVDVVIADATTADAAEAAGVAVVHAPLLWNAIIMMDRNGEKSAPVGNPKVREALMYAVDREVVADAVFGKYGAPNAIMVTPGYEGFVDTLEASYVYDPDRARALLAEAGYADGFTIDVLNSNRNGLESLWLQSLAGYLNDVGVQINIHEPEGSGVLEALQNATYPAFSFFGQIEEPNLLVQEQLVPNAGLLNPFKYEDKTLLDLYRTYQSSSPEQASEVQKQMTERIVRQAYYLTYSVSDVVYFHGPEITGLDVSTAQPIMNLMTLAPVN